MEQNKIEINYVDKKVFFYSIFLLITLTISSILMIYFILNAQINEKMISVKNENIEENNELMEEVVTENVKNVYLIKQYNEKIGVYENDSLIYTIDKYVFTLPENDKRLLKNGIILDSVDELYKVIEEYSK